MVSVEVMIICYLTALIIPMNIVSMGGLSTLSLNVSGSKISVKAEFLHTNIIELMKSSRKVIYYIIF
jgi:hypothetical protein